MSFETQQIPIFRRNNGSCVLMKDHGKFSMGERVLKLSTLYCSDDKE